jgi:hypothetical protein
MQTLRRRNRRKRIIIILYVKGYHRAVQASTISLNFVLRLLIQRSHQGGTVKEFSVYSLHFLQCYNLKYSEDAEKEENIKERTEVKQVVFAMQRRR